MNVTPKEARTLVAEALRSGKYLQIKGVLRRSDNCFCAEGVCCEVYRQITGLCEWFPPGNGFSVFHFGEGEEHTYGSILPKYVKKWLGISDVLVKNADGFVIRIALSTINDNGMSFEEIADILESQPGENDDN